MEQGREEDTTTHEMLCPLSGLPSGCRDCVPALVLLLLAPVLVGAVMALPLVLVLVRLLVLMGWRRCGCWCWWGGGPVAAGAGGGAGSACAGASDCHWHRWAHVHAGICACVLDRSNHRRAVAQTLTMPE